MGLLKNKWFWAIAFGLLFVASIDLWAWDWTEPDILGLPYAIVYFAALEAILFMMVLAFSKYYWTEDEGAS